VIPIHRWPGHDLAAWQAAVQPGDPFEDAGPAATWRSATKALVVRCYGRWLGFLLDLGCLDPEALPDSRIDEEVLRHYIARLRSQCLDTTTTMYIEGLARALTIMAPHGDWSWLWRAAQHLRGTMRRRKRKDLKVRPSQELFDLGLRLMDKADAPSPLVCQRAVLFRDGLLIALLAARPLRLKNLAALEIDRHVVRTGEDFRLCLSPDETKTHVHIDLPIDGELADRLERYLEDHRPTLLGASQSPLLWITHDGRAMRSCAVYKSIVTRTRKAFGVAINPHLFRDCAATSLAIEDPGHVQVAATLLGHRSLSSTTRHYNQATTLTAARTYARTIADLRRGTLGRRDREWRPS
jgi:site-specific recombinase XerD